jgi:hypothetical protein
MAAIVRCWRAMDAAERARITKRAARKVRVAQAIHATAERRRAEYPDLSVSELRRLAMVGVRYCPLADDARG